MVVCFSTRASEAIQPNKHLCVPAVYVTIATVDDEILDRIIREWRRL